MFDDLSSWYLTQPLFLQGDICTIHCCCCHSNRASGLALFRKVEKLRTTKDEKLRPLKFGNLRPCYNFGIDSNKLFPLYSVSHIKQTTSTLTLLDPWWYCRIGLTLLKSAKPIVPRLWNFVTINTYLFYISYITFEPIACSIVTPSRFCRDTSCSSF